jgi:hypothetical protein
MTWPSDLSFGRACSVNGYGNFICPGNLTCGNINDYEFLSPEPEQYQERSYMNFDVTNYDNVGTSLLSVF